ncbi:type I glyceraldehyde-3-phosphate dehydrogenase [Aestuariicella hydrocarbonica]|uniref:Type I glyceraldehyde-3-phosphate dehydrogenase n=1 Tax=Pseudomaricurvus hydrocarbonicus TaxID=1470433 RepID=A0A9E5MQ94_9GAMM|nr:type I glyceraldehyde-3-phosphate dehydrogenase [Aestuariicella hydrocarbonica]
MEQSPSCQPLRLAINGYGRIGRCVLRALFEAGLQDQLQVVAINELADCKTIAHLTKYDSTHGRFPGAVSVADDCLHIDDHAIQVLHCEHLTDLPWAALGVDLVLECTGAFSDRATAQRHIDQGARRVLFSQPGQPDVDATIVYGVNEQTLSASHTIVSNASCTTNCSIPVIKALHDAFGVDSGVITTLHSAMNDQPVIDAYHHTDLRKTRSAINSMIPVDTGLAQGIERLLPELAGRFEAQAMRVPIANVSAIDLSVVVQQDVSVEAVNSMLRQTAATAFHGVLGYTEELLASCDFNHDSRSGIVDAGQTRVAGKRLVKVLTWFDNEWGYANRMLDVVLAWQKSR